MYENIKGKEQICCVDNKYVGWQLDLMDGFIHSFIHSANKRSRVRVLWDTPCARG